MQQNLPNLVPRSLVDEAEGEIWQSKKICFFLIGCSIWLLPNPLSENWRGFPPAANFLQTQVLTWFFLRFSDENEKRIRKDERRKDLEVICHSGLNNFCNMIILLPKSQTCHPARAPLHLPHMLFWHKTLQTPPLFFFFFCIYEVAQSPYVNSILGTCCFNKIWR